MTMKTHPAPSNLVKLFKDIRNYLAGMTHGITRDEKLIKEILKILLCKLYSEVNTECRDLFRATFNEPAPSIKERISTLYRSVKIKYAGVLELGDDIELDPDSLAYVIRNLQNISIKRCNRDALREAFEVFISPILRGGEGQFFTPRNLIRMMVEILDPSPEELVIDPACGLGGFLTITVEYVEKKTASNDVIKEFVSDHIYGIDKDCFLAKMAKAIITLMNDSPPKIFCENSLEEPTRWDSETQRYIKLGTFDVVLTNPPHGSKIQVRGKRILRQYELGHVWKRDRRTGRWIKTKEVRDKQSPQILFIERCIQLTKNRGRIGIVVPETILGNPSYGYVTEFLLKKTRILGVVSLPEEMFQPYTHNKVCALFLEKNPTTNNYPIFMAIARWCGHDSRGRPIPYDDLPRIAENYRRVLDGGVSTKLGFLVTRLEIKKGILLPKYYDPEILSELESLKDTCELVTLGDLVKRGIISITTGVEVGKLAYGTGSIPFIRTSDIANYEIKVNPKQGVSEEVYLKYRRKADLKEGDILMVRDGTYLVGTCCIVTKYDIKALFQSHIYRIRVLMPDIISPYLLLALLNTPIVQKQIRAKQFTQSIIDSLGDRIMEIIIPIPKDKELREKIAREVKETIERRAELREKLRRLFTSIFG